jgi:hypothetical protein
MNGTLGIVIFVLVGLFALDAVGRDTLAEQLPVFGGLALVLLCWQILRRRRDRGDPPG